MYNKQFIIYNLKCKIIYYVIVTFFLLSFTNSIEAVTISVNNAPTAINNEPFNVDVVVNGASSGTNYLRIDLYKEGTTNYFGETHNGNSWYAGSEGKQYFPITIGEDKIASASIAGKFGSPASSEYNGPGQYKLKIRRYTSSGNSASSEEQTSLAVQINVVNPSPTPTPNPTPAATASPKVSSSPSSSVSTTVQSVVSISPSSIVKATAKMQVRDINPSYSPLPSEAILGQMSIVVSPSPQITNTKSRNNNTFLGAALVFAGILLSGAAGFLVYKKTNIE